MMERKRRGGKKETKIVNQFCISYRKPCVKDLHLIRDQSMTHKERSRRNVKTIFE